MGGAAHSRSRDSAASKRKGDQRRIATSLNHLHHGLHTYKMNDTDAWHHETNCTLSVDEIQEQRNQASEQLFAAVEDPPDNVQIECLATGAAQPVATIKREIFVEVASHLYGMQALADVLPDLKLATLPGQHKSSTRRYRSIS